MKQDTDSFKGISNNFIYYFKESKLCEDIKKKAGVLTAQIYIFGSKRIQFQSCTSNAFKNQGKKTHSNLLKL